MNKEFDEDFRILATKFYDDAFMDGKQATLEVVRAWLVANQGYDHEDIGTDIIDKFDYDFGVKK